MYTHCPSCDARFRIRAVHLRAAHGQVRCGACGHAFDALAYLADTVDELPSRDDLDRPPPPQPVVNDAPSLRMGVADSEDTDLPGGLRGRETDDTVDELLRAPDIRREDYEIDAGHWVEEHSPPGRSRLWVVLAVLLVLAGAVQASWFNRDILYHHYPQLLPLVERLCIHLGCEVYRERRPDAIELLSRDVRLHPVYEDVLLINATITNRAERRQPYPHIELALYDTGGRVIAYRRFTPQDYLDGSLPVAAGMPPDTPVHVVLEVSGPAVEAVSFEFGFL